MPRVVKSREEFEGEVYESLVLVEGRDLPLLDGGERTEIGHERRRVDGTARVTGRARYTQDVYLPAMLFVRVLRSPYPRARVRRIDTKRAKSGTVEAKPAKPQTSPKIQRWRSTRGS